MLSTGLHDLHRLSPCGCCSHVARPFYRCKLRLREDPKPDYPPALTPRVNLYSRPLLSTSKQTKSPLLCPIVIATSSTSQLSLDHCKSFLLGSPTRILMPPTLPSLIYSSQRAIMILRRESDHTCPLLKNVDSFHYLLNKI